MAEGMTEDRKTLVSRLKHQLKSKSDRKYIIEDPRCKITSDRQIVDGKLDFDVKEEFENTFHLKIENTGTNTLHLLSYFTLTKHKYFTVKDEHNVTQKSPRSLNPGDSYDIEVTCRCRSLGRHETALAFEFKSLENIFHIVRVFVARCMTSLGKKLKPVAPYKRPPFRGPVRRGSVTAWHGQRPTGQPKMQLEYQNKLGQYKIPPKIRSQMSSSTFPAERDKQILDDPLSWTTYSRRFELLLYLEELQMAADMRKYSNEMTNTQMVREGNLLVLKVTGLSENRPSLLCGDELWVYPVGMKEKYRGFVHSVQRDSVKLRFHQRLLDIFKKNMKFEVEFVVSRLVLRIWHRAAEDATKCQLEPVLFPSAPPSSDKQPPPPNLSGLFDGRLEENPEQTDAVKHIVAGSSKPAPYVVFGPPGTGKTVTMSKAIVQIVNTKMNCHILACAPTNSAADVLCSTILKCKNMNKREVYRMYAKSVNTTCIPAELKEYSNLERNTYDYPRKATLKQYRIIVTTLLTAGRFVSANFKDHFTHVFVDEAGQAMEPECLVPVAGLLNAKSGQVVLAGDPEQLGPIIRSPLAQKYGLGMSLIERLKGISLYQRPFDKRFVTKLVRNYRSHVEILKVPSVLFYNDELEAHAKDSYSYCSWKGLRQKGFPVIFHVVKGEEEREASSPSFFNRSEVEVVMDYVKRLLKTDDSTSHSTTPEDIGIITPYRKQVEKIYKALETVGENPKIKDVKSLKVGTVEEFQGQERKVILVSTVRSGPGLTSTDKQSNLDFIMNKKRFNVAITRAKALLIVVGNPKVLRPDRHWATFIKHCKDHNSYENQEDDDDDDDDDDNNASP